MNKLKKIIISMVLFFAFFNISIFAFNNTVFATDTKFESFVATSLDKGYLNSTIEITQISEHKYKVDFMIKENILGIDYGFYITPTIVESLAAIGFECQTLIEQQYAYNYFSITTKNLNELFDRLSVLPYIDFEYYIDEESKEQIIKGQFQEDFYKEEREENKLINDLFDSNIFIVKFKPISEKFVSSDASLKTDDGFYMWIYSTNNKATDFSTIIYPIPFYSKVIISVICIVILLLAIFIARILFKKYKENKTFNNNPNKDYNDFDYNYDNNYNDYNDYY